MIELPCDPAQLRRERARIRDALRAGRTVLLTHVAPPGRPLDPRELLAHYERLAGELRHVSWRSEAPSFEEGRATVRLVPLGVEEGVDRVRVIAPDGQHLGALDRAEALRRARDFGLDLVEVDPRSVPPTCRIMDRAKHRYALKRRRRGRPVARGGVTKEVRLRPGTAEHDLRVKLERCRRFLEKGYGVQLTVLFRGRELVHDADARQLLEFVAHELTEVSASAAPPHWESRRLVLRLRPV